MTPSYHFLILIFITWSFCNLYAAKLPEGFKEEKIAEDLDPTCMAIAPDGRVFIGEKKGIIRLVRDDEMLENPFYTVEVDNNNERGLSGITLHPDFEINGYVYIFYTVPEENRNQIVRLTANGDFAIPGSEQLILSTDELSGSIHNGGAMHFGPDHKLFISTGDGTQGENGQNLSSLLGKFLRINDDGSIPEDNPYFLENEGIYRSIWAYGFRNSFSFAIHPHTAQILANDVGRDKWEEINDVKKGGNYGWNITTGISHSSSLPADYINPTYSYDHSVGCSVIGATFYEGENLNFPEKYHGKYFFGDYCRGYIKVMDPISGRILETFATEINRPIQLAIGTNGELYYLERNGIGGGSEEDNTISDNGVLWKISYTGSGAPFISEQPQSTLASIGENASFDIQVGGNDSLRLQWYKNGILIPNTNETSFTILDVSLDDNNSKIYCEISNDFGKIVSEEAILSVTSNTRPFAEIKLNTPENLYSAGDTIFFEVDVKDNEDEQIALDQYTWKIDFHHIQHTHPALNATSGIEKGYYVIPRIGEISPEVWYRLYFTVEDSGGLRTTVHKDIFPKILEFIIDTEPSGLGINSDGLQVKTPFVVTSVAGVFRTLQAIKFQSFNNESYVFRNWNGNEANSLISFYASSEIPKYIASFEKLSKGTGTGLEASFYNNTNFTGSASFTKIDTSINFDWGVGNPHPSFNYVDDFSIRWEGEIESLTSGEYTFYTRSDDGTRLWVNDELVIDQWVNQPVNEVRGFITLEEKTKYPIKLEYFEGGGEAVIELRWKTSEFKKEIVPKAQLYPPLKNNIFANFNTTLIQNPVRLELPIEILSTRSGSANFEIYKLSGELVNTGNILFPIDNSRAIIEVSQLSSGLYFIRFFNETTETIHEFIKI